MLRPLPYNLIKGLKIDCFSLSSQEFSNSVRVSMEDKEKNIVKDGDGYGRVIKYLGIFGGAQGLSILLNMVRTKIASILLGVAGQSVIALSNRTVQMFSDATGLSLSFSAIRALSDAYENADEAVVERCIKVVRSVALFTGLLGMLLMLIVTPYISDWIFEDNSAYYSGRFLALSPVVFFMAVSNGEIAILRGIRQLNKVAVYSVATSVISLLVAVPLYFFVGVGGVFPAIFATAFLQMSVLLYFSLPLYAYRAAPFSFALLREGIDIVKMGAGFIFSSIFSSFALWLICALLSDIGDGKSAGLFNTAIVMITMLPGVLFAALDSEYYPRLSGAVENVTLRNRMINEQVEVQLLVQSPLLVAFMVAMPLLVPLFYDGEFMPAVSMAQIALMGMFMRTMTYPVSFLTLAKSDTLLFVFLESIYNLLLVALVVAGYVTMGFVGVGAGIALAHTLDFLLVYGMLKFRYGLRLSGNVAKYFFMQLPLFVAMAIVVVGGFSGRSYWTMGAICTLLSLLLSIYFLKKQTILPDTFRRLYKKISRKFKK